MQSSYVHRAYAYGTRCGKGVALTQNRPANPLAPIGLRVLLILHVLGHLALYSDDETLLGIDAQLSIDALRMTPHRIQRYAESL